MHAYNQGKVLSLSLSLSPFPHSIITVCHPTYPPPPDCGPLLERLSYSAPEAAAIDGQPIAASDIWSIGVILNEMVMGKVCEPGACWGHLVWEGIVLKAL